MDPATLLKPRTKRVLDALLPRRCSLTELARATGASKPALLPVLKELVASGIVKREDVRTSEGREIFFELRAAQLHVELVPDRSAAIAWFAIGPLDPAFPLAGQIRSPEGRQEILALLRAIRQTAARPLERVFLVLFGSFARDEVTWKSDIDLLVVHDDRDDVDESVIQPIHDAIADAQALLSHPVQPLFAHRAAFVSGRNARLAAAREEGLVLHGRPEEVDLWRCMKRYRSISI